MARLAMCVMSMADWLTFTERAVGAILNGTLSEPETSVRVGR